MNPARPLSVAQMARLDRLSTEREDAKVIGWAAGGPVVRYGTTGTLRHLTPLGRLEPTSYAAIGRVS